MARNWGIIGEGVHGNEMMGHRSGDLELDLYLGVVIRGSGGWSGLLRLSPLRPGNMARCFVGIIFILSDSAVFRADEDGGS